MSTNPMSTRVIVVEVPDWPVVAFQRTTSRHAATRAARDPQNDRVSVQASARDRIAVMHAMRVISCSPAARSEGVRVGQRRRDAQAACPSLTLASADPGRDERAFLPVLARIDGLTPGVQLLRPGLIAIRARGPARFYGSEEAAVRAILALLADLHLSDTRAGVADGIFTAERAVRTAGGDTPMRIIPRGASSAFLAALPIGWIDDDELTDLLVKLGITTLGGFASLDADQVRSRLHERGARLHALAGGADSRTIQPHAPPPELARTIEFETPLEAAEQVAFASRTTADDVIAALGEAGLICTEVRITLTDDRGTRNERSWLHPTQFDAPALLDRIRWQLQATTSPEDDLNNGIVQVHMQPIATDDSSHHQPTLLGQGPDQRLFHAISRVQAMLGYRGVVAPIVGGGRWLSERESRIPWGDGERPSLPPDRPWPGALPDPLPSEVFREARTTIVTASDGASVTVSSRGQLSAEPQKLSGRPIVAWAGPWPVIERSWDADRARRAHRFQMVDDEQIAWLVYEERGSWWLEGRYG